MKKPVPGGGKPKPAAKPKKLYPKAKVLYDYNAQDTDELSLEFGDVVEVLKEGECRYLFVLSPRITAEEVL